jgi:hypothetical protein
MIFPYGEVKRAGQARLVPLLPISIFGPSEAIDVVALVDSGAEQSVFGQELAEQLGIPLAKGERVVIIGVGEHDLPGVLVQVDLRLSKHRWTGPVIFCRELKQRAILGQAGFFAYFDVTFRYRRKEIIVRRVR